MTIPLKIFHSHIEGLLLCSLSKSACIDTGSVTGIDCCTVRNQRLLRSSSIEKLQSFLWLVLFHTKDHGKEFVVCINFSVINEILETDWFSDCFSDTIWESWGVYDKIKTFRV